MGADVPECLHNPRPPLIFADGNADCVMVRHMEMAIEKIIGIVTDVVKHSDRHNVVTLFTRHQGRVSLLSSAGAGKTGRMRNASLMPLSVISADINFNPTRELQFLGKFSREILWKDLYFNPIKSAIGIFLSEFLNTYLRHSAPDAALWDYIATAIKRLDTGKRGVANFHIAFLIEFLSFAGIRPDLSEWRGDSWFDMRGGTMSLMPPGHRDTLAPQEAAALPLLARMHLRTAPLFRFTSQQRRELLNVLLRYYSLHFPGLSALKSPAVLAEVFG